MRTVIFDLDGTLADTSGDLLAAANAAFTRAGHPAPLLPGDAPTALIGGRPMLRLGSARLELGWDETEIDRQYRVLIDAYADGIAVHTRLYDGAIDAIERLRRAGIAVGVCTNKPDHLAEALLRELGVRDMFGTMIGANTLPVRKPDPAPLLRAIADLGGQPGQACMIGDTITDRVTGEAAGVPVVLVPFGPEGHEVTRHRPDALLHHYDTLDATVAPFLARI